MIDFDNQKQITKAVKEKNEMIRDISDKKGDAIERSNTINNAMLFWQTIRQNPNLKVDEELKNLIGLMRQISRLKKVYDLDGKTIDEIFSLLNSPF